MKMLMASELKFWPELTLLSEGEDREIQSVYCCDLLSIAMGRAKADSAWVTVMANLNAIAVATLTDVACVIIAENMAVDEATVARAKENGVWLFLTQQPVFDAAVYVHKLLPGSVK